MRADWFETLSTETRAQFFYQLLIGLLSGDSSRQQEILDSTQFRDLPASSQADLLRHVGTDSLSNGQDIEFGSACLAEALRRNPSDMKARALLAALSLDTSVATALLNGWHAAHVVQKRIRTLGSRTPKPVPDGLFPIE